MTLTDLQKLAETDPERIRVMVAEIVGYEFKDEGDRYPDHEDWQKYKAVYMGEGFIGLAKPDWIPVPEYTRNLNDMAKLEAGLTDEEYDSFAAWLFIIRPGKRVLSASALHRAIAYILTKQETKGDE